MTEKQPLDLNTPDSDECYPFLDFITLGVTGLTNEEQRYVSEAITRFIYEEYASWREILAGSAAYQASEGIEKALSLFDSVEYYNEDEQPPLLFEKADLLRKRGDETAANEIESELQEGETGDYLPDIFRFLALTKSLKYQEARELIEWFKVYYGSPHTVPESLTDLEIMDYTANIPLKHEILVAESLQSVGMPDESLYLWFIFSSHFQVELSSAISIIIDIYELDQKYSNHTWNHLVQFASESVVKRLEAACNEYQEEKDLKVINEIRDNIYRIQLLIALLPMTPDIGSLDLSDPDAVRNLADEIFSKILIDEMRLIPVIKALSHALPDSLLRAIVERNLKRYPNNQEFISWMYELAVKENTWKLGLELNEQLEGLVADPEKKSKLQYERIGLLEKLGEINNGADLALKIWNLAPELSINPDLKRLLKKTGRNEDLIKVYQQQLSRNLLNEGELLDLVDLLIKDEKGIQAEELLRSELSIRPDNQKAMERLISILIRSGRSQEIKKMAPDLILTNYRNHEFYAIRGEMALESGDMVNGFDLFNRAIRAGKPEDGYELRFAEVLLSNKLFKKAATQCEKFIKNGMMLNQVYPIYISALEGLGRTVEAEKAREKYKKHQIKS